MNLSGALGPKFAKVDDRVHGKAPRKQWWWLAGEATSGCSTRPVIKLCHPVGLFFVKRQDDVYAETATDAIARRDFAAERLHVSSDDPQSEARVSG